MPNRSSRAEPSLDVVVVGGGAAGVFGAVACAEAAPGTRVLVLEKSPQFLSKVRISGGGRCNVTHSCDELREFAGSYPRGGKALLGPLHKFGPADTIQWFESRGVKLKTEPDGRMFPVTDSSQTIIDCLLRSARAADVELRANAGVVAVQRSGEGFQLSLQTGESLTCRRLMLATGGCRSTEAGGLIVALGHTLIPPVPSLFTFHLGDSANWLKELAGIAVEAEISLPAVRLREKGPVLITHEGLSGPAVLRASAWGARPLHELSYRFVVKLNWLAHLQGNAVTEELSSRRRMQSSRYVVNSPVAPLPTRLWEKLVLAAGIHRQTRWAELPKNAQHSLTQQVTGTELQVTGKSLNRDEFVTCGGVKLGEVDFGSLQSRICPELYFGGELLDIDGITGGFNFQAAWTTGWIAGRSLAGLAV